MNRITTFDLSERVKCAVSEVLAGISMFVVVPVALVVGTYLENWMSLLFYQVPAGAATPTNNIQWWEPLILLAFGLALLFGTVVSMFALHAVVRRAVYGILSQEN